MTPPLYSILIDNGERIGRAYVETDPDDASRATVVRSIVNGQYTGKHSKFDKTLEVDEGSGTARDVTEEIPLEGR